MDLETEPLISSSASQRRSYSTSVEGGSSSETSDLNLSVFNGIEHENDDSYEMEYALYTDKITFTWSEINAFALQKSSNTIGFVKYFQRKKSQQPQGKQILSNVCGIAKPGELLAILGSSGAGKTTLLNILTSRSSPNLIISGSRCANGIPLHSNSLTSQLAYVQQDDLFIGNLTVREHLVFQALVRMDKHVPYNQRILRVEEVISELGLSDCQHTMIGVKGRIKGISGGEMKRLSFAAEILTNPSLMFCDEPTSGLDSFMALHVIQVLKKLAYKGKTVVCTIHQPSSDVYSLFDKILLMAEGRVAFLGTPNEATEFFSNLQAPCPINYNPSDYFIQLLAILPGREESCKQAVNMICDRFERSDLGVRIAVKASTLARSESSAHVDFLYNEMSYNKRYKASWYSQFRAVLWRSWITIIKEPLLIKVRLIQTIIVALLIGVIYYGQTLNKDGVMNINGAIFIFLTNMTFQNVFAVINVFCAELPIFLRENKNGMYRTDVYFICKTLADLPLFIMLPVTFISICYYLIGLNSQQPRIFIAIAILILVANSAISFGYFVSCLSSSISMALSMAPPLIIPFLLFGGYFLNVSAIPIYFKWLGYLSWFRYGNEALMVNQWTGVNINCTNSDSSICPKNGEIILQTYSFSESNFSMDLIALAILICGFRLLAYLALLFKTYKYE